MCLKHGMYEHHCKNKFRPLIQVPNEIVSKVKKLQLSPKSDLIEDRSVAKEIREVSERKQRTNKI